MRWTIPRAACALPISPAHLYSWLHFWAKFYSLSVMLFFIFLLSDQSVIISVATFKNLLSFWRGPFDSASLGDFDSAIALTDIPHLLPTSLPPTETVVTGTARSRAKGPTAPRRAPTPDMHPHWNSGPPHPINLASLVDRAQLS